MIGPPAADDCLFCQVVTAPPAELEWHDCPLALIPGVGGVIAGLGAFVPGYVLVFPHQHVESTRLIPAQRSSRFQALMRKVVDAVSGAYGPVTVFEHGSCTLAEVRRSACLSHAHVHVLPGSYALSGYIPLAAGPPEPTHAGYLYLKEPATNPQFYRDPGISQFFRRCIAEQLGIGDQWDYLVFPQLDNVLATIGRLRGQLL